MSSNVKVQAPGVGRGSLLFLLFLTLKLCHVITWSWWLVCLPLYAPIAIIIGFMIFMFALAMVGATVSKPYYRRKK